MTITETPETKNQGWRRGRLAAAAAAAQGMYIDKPSTSHGAEALQGRRVQIGESGVMAALKAQLRADIFAAMVEPSPGEQASTAEGVGAAR